MMRMLGLVILVVYTQVLSAQASDELKIWNSAGDLTENYEWRIRQSKLDGVYIPKDLKDVFRRLDQLVSTESKEKFSAMPETDACRKLHFSLGRWIILNWRFYEGSRLSHYLKKLGLTHPEDMATFLMLSYHRHLNEEDLKVKEQIETLIKLRQESYKHRVSKGKMIETYRIKKDSLSKSQ